MLFVFIDFNDPYLTLLSKINEIYVGNWGVGITQKANVAQIRFPDDRTGVLKSDFQIRTEPISQGAINQTRARCFVGRVASHFICMPQSEDGSKQWWRRESGGETENWRSIWAEASLQASMRSLHPKWSIFLTMTLPHCSSVEQQPLQVADIWQKKLKNNKGTEKKKSEQSYNVKEAINTNGNKLVRFFDVWQVFLFNQ